MRKSIFLMVLSLVAVLAVACGGGNGANNKANGAGGNGGDTANGGDANGGGSDVDAYALYKKEGRKWKHKSTAKMEGMDPMVSFMAYEVVSVADDHAMYKLTMQDKDGKPMAGMDPTETKVEFKAHETTTTTDAPKVETTEETITVEAGEFECIVTEMSGTKTWSSKKFPGLVVKMEGATNSMELVEWTE